MTRVALVGASEKTLWSHWLLTNLRRYDDGTEVAIVNPSTNTVYGIDTVATVSELGRAPDVGVVMVRADRCPQAVRDLVAIGTKSLVVISSGFKELRTPEGIERERELTAVARDAGAVLVGPNCVGFADFGRGLCAISEPIPAVRPGSVSIISQSGGLLASVMGAITEQDVGINKAYSIGNGAGFDVSTALGELADDDGTTTVCCVLESISDVEAFAAATRRAEASGKHVVVVKVGRSASAQAVAVSHTGAAVGNDAVVDAWFRRIGVRRAASVSEAGVLVGLLERFGAASPDRGVFIATGSGGGCGVAADLAEQAAVRLAELSGATVAALRELLPDGVYIGNPLDVTGAATDAAGLTAYDHVMRDPHVGLVLQPFTIPWPDETPGRRWHRESFLAIRRAASDAQIPLVQASFYPQSRTPWVAALDTAPDRGPTSVQDDLSATLAALASVYPRTRPVARSHGDSHGAKRPTTVLAELPARDLLAKLGFPLVPGGWAATEDAAVNLAQTFDGPWVLKVASETIEHKGRVGGVRLGIADEAGLRRAAQAIQSGLAEHGVSQLADGFLVQQMVFGPEILVGLLADADGRRTLNLGVGGWAAEAYGDIRTVLLPTADGELESLIETSGFGRLLGSEQRAALCDIVGTFAGSFVSGDLARFDTVEINPIILSARGPVIADALLAAG